MGWYEVFFPEIAEAEHLRSISDSMRRQARRKSRPAPSTPDTSTASEDDLGFLTLVVMASLQQMFDKGILDRDELIERLRSLDKLDGVEDGKIDLIALRTVFGIPAPEKPEPPPPPVAPTPRRRRRR